MAFEHVQFPVYGMQFHPESILTEGGFELLANFLRLAEMSIVEDFGGMPANELCQPAVQPALLPDRPVTF